MNRTWPGGKAGNRASYGGNWSPTGVPQDGDTLTISRGTMNVVGDVIPAADTLNVDGTSTVNFTNNGVYDNVHIGGFNINPTINLRSSEVKIIDGTNGTLKINARGEW